MQTTLTPPTVNPRRRALVALLLLVPAPTIGVACMLHLMPDAGGKIVSFIAKAWIALLPLLWTRFVDKEPLRFTKPTRYSLKVGLIVGLILCFTIIEAIANLRGWIDLGALRQRAAEIGFDQLPAYIGMFAYIIAVNSLLEEYVWRWFVFRKCETLLGGQRGQVAVVFSALLFTLHHIVALAAWVDWRLNAIASLGVFIGGVTWSALYLKFRSVWPGYICHVLADIGIAVAGYFLVFG